MENEFKTGDIVLDLDNLNYGEGFITNVGIWIHIRFKNLTNFHTLYGSKLYVPERNNFVFPEIIANLHLIRSQLKELKDDA